MRYSHALKEVSGKWLTPAGPSIIKSINTTYSRGQTISLSLKEFNRSNEKNTFGDSARETFARALLQLPRCGRDVAEYIGQEYGTVRIFRDQMKAYGSQDNAIKALRSQSIPGKKYPVGPAVAKALYQTFCTDF